jgi:hypothetical protein
MGTLLHPRGLDNFISLATSGAGLERGEDFEPYMEWPRKETFDSECD